MLKTIDEVIKINEDYADTLDAKEAEYIKDGAGEKLINAHRERAAHCRQLAAWLRELQSLKMEARLIEVRGNAFAYGWACDNCDAVYSHPIDVDWRYCPECGAKFID